MSVNEEHGLHGSVALVTGAARGIGHASAVALAMRGATVIGADRDWPSTDQTEGSELSGRVILDVRDAPAVDRVVSEVVAEHGRLDVLVVSAGVAQTPAGVREISDEEWQRVIDINLTGSMRCCRAAGRVMAAQKGGAIVNIASINGHTAAPLVAAYNVSKAGLLSLTRTLALELAYAGVRVNAICPGPIYTDLNKTVVASRAATLGISEAAMRDRIREAIPIGRWGEPEDIADAVVFLAGPASSWITGEVLTVSGGLHAVPAARPSE